MKRKDLWTARKGMAIVMAAAVVMSQSMMVYADQEPQDEIHTVTVKADYEEDDSATAKSVTTSDAHGVDARSSETGEATVEISGKVSVKNESYVARDIYTDADGGKVTVKTGDVEATNSKAGGTAEGVYAVTSGINGGSIDVKTENILVSSTEDVSYAKGVDVYAYSGDDKEKSGSVNITTGDITSSAHTGVGVETYSYGKNTNVDIRTGAIKAKDGESEYGIKASVVSGSKQDLTVRNGISAVSENEAYGTKQVGGDGTEFEVAVIDGDIDVNGYTAVGIDLATSGKSEVNVYGDVISNHDGIKLADKETEAEGTKITVTVTGGDGTGDILANDTAVDIKKVNKDSKITVDAYGTIDGGEHNIVLEEDSVTEGLHISVWKIETKDKETGKEKAVVETKKTVIENEEKKTVYEEYSPDEAISFIDYYIKVAPVETEGASLKANETAKEGEQVYLKVTVPDGYAIDHFYTGEDGTEVEFLKDEDNGEWYIVVPRGGGVFVGVKLKEDSTSNGGSTNNDPTNNNSSNNATNNTSSDDSSSNDSSSDNGGKTVGSGTGSESNSSPVVPGLRTMTVNGQPLEMNITVSNLNNSLTQAFSDMLTVYASYGMLDLNGNYVAVPENSVVKDSFTFTAEGVEGFVTAYIEFKNYKEGDFIMCSYLDPLGNTVFAALTPLMVEGTGLVLLLPANCNLALAGSAV